MWKRNREIHCRLFLLHLSNNKIKCNAIVRGVYAINVAKLQYGFHWSDSWPCTLAGISDGLFVTALYFHILLLYTGWLRNLCEYSWSYLSQRGMFCECQQLWRYEYLRVTNYYLVNELYFWGACYIGFLHKPPRLTTKRVPENRSWNRFIVDK
jgi:hypothetical protein